MPSCTTAMPKLKRYKGRKRNFLTLDLDYFTQDTIQDLRVR